MISSKNGHWPVFTRYHYFATVASLAGGLGDTSLLEEKYPPEDVHINSTYKQTNYGTTDLLSGFGSWVVTNFWSIGASERLRSKC